MENKIDPRTDTPENDVIDIRELIKKYLRNWHWFVISVVFCFIVAFLYLKIIHNKYQVRLQFCFATKIQHRNCLI